MVCVSHEYFLKMRDSCFCKQGCKEYTIEKLKMELICWSPQSFVNFGIVFLPPLKNKIFSVRWKNTIHVRVLPTLCFFSEDDFSIVIRVYPLICLLKMKNLF